jgi:hypothetical protein
VKLYIAIRVAERLLCGTTASAKGSAAQEGDGAELMILGQPEVLEHSVG